MNIVLRDPEKGNFYISSLKKTDDAFIAVGKVVSPQGKVVSLGQPFSFLDRRAAEHKVRDLIKIKIKRRGWYQVNMEDLPKDAQSQLEVPPEMRVTPEEMVLILREAQSERYVEFANVSGIEEFFDLGVEYIGYDDASSFTVKVFDKFGTLRECFRSRMARMDYTERAIESSTEKMRKATDALTLEKGKK